MLQFLFIAATATDVTNLTPEEYHSSGSTAHHPPPPPPFSSTAATPLTSRPPPHLSEAASISLLKYEYKWQQGFIGAGGDVEPPALATVDEALARCDVLARCRGITYEGNKSTSEPQHIYFKMSSGVAKATGWSAWLKTAAVTPPAVTVAVGGSSKLELRLREDFYSVQNLSRSGDLWSFTRPLDSASTLPNCAHLGDLTLRIGSSMFSTITLGAKAHPMHFDQAHAWIEKASSSSSSNGVGQILAAQNITELLAKSVTDGAPFPLDVMRSYERSSDGTALILRFTLTSTSDTPVEITGAGMALPESEGNPPAGLPTIVWNDPHVGGDHGFVEFVRVVDDEATLLVTADLGHKVTTPLEAWRPMLEDLGKGDAYEWVVASKSWAAEWLNNTQYPFVNMSDALKHTYPAFAVNPSTPWPSTDGKKSVPKLASPGIGAGDPWNAPTSITLKPKESRTFALRLQLATGGPRTRDATLTKMGAPVLHAVPGYVVSTDMAKPMIYVLPPNGLKVKSIKAEVPAGGNATIAFTPSSSSSTADGKYLSYALKPTGYGRVRVRITFSDSSSTTAHYYVLPPLSQQVSMLGSHLADTAWLPREFIDPFGRSASVMPWDRSLCDNGKACGHVLNDARAYDAGLSDDAGGGNPLGFASKVRAMPTAHEASRIDEYIQYTLYGIKTDTAKPPYKSLQIRDDEGPNGTVPHNVDGVRMTMFYYDKDLNNHTSGHFEWDYSEADKCHKPFGGPTWCMTENIANATYRGFNYPHQISSYWAMYHVARFTNFATRMPWHWYLYRAGRTCLKLGRAGVGFMDGTVAREVLNDLLAEGDAGNITFKNLSITLKANMKARQMNFASRPYPYGSEFGFDTTGQEEVVVWNLYFGNESVAKKTVDHVLSYMRNSPTWAYHGGARSWGDIGNNGKYLSTFGTGANDRGQMHYRSGLNMIPLIEWYRLHPEEGTFLLEVSMGAITGQMTNILPKTGETSMMFHAVPHMLANDPHSGDYGLGFFGNALESGGYYVVDEALGELCFLCSTASSGGSDAAAAFLSRLPLPPSEAAAAAAFQLITLEDAYRIAVFLEPIGLYITSQCGQIISVGAPPPKPLVAEGSTVSIALTFDKAPHCPMLRLKLTKTAMAKPGKSFVVSGAKLVRGAYEMEPVKGGTTTVKLQYVM